MNSTIPNPFSSEELKRNEELCIKEIKQCLDLLDEADGTDYLEILNDIGDFTSLLRNYKTYQIENTL